MISNRYSRQSFLGDDSSKLISSCTVGVVGLGGGGSHIVQQLAHIGFKKYVLYDSDNVDKSNLNRLVGATEEDVEKERPKIKIAERVILGLQSDASIRAYKSKWQDHPLQLRSCDIVFGCVDSFEGRRELELCARRYMIPYIDIGMDVHKTGNQPPVMAGQVVLSMPGGPCLKCLGFLSDKESPDYGDAGPRAQVIWANGVLASLAVGFAIDIITGWTKANPKTIYLSYEANTGVIQPHKILDYLKFANCPHFTPAQVGEPTYKEL